MSELTRRWRKAEARRQARFVLRRIPGQRQREPTEDEVQQAVLQTPDFPKLIITMKYFKSQICKCLRVREAGKCDCLLCAYVHYNIRQWHRARGKWDEARRCDPETCDACMPGSAYRRASQSPDEMMKYILCPKCLPCDIQSSGFPPPLNAPEKSQAEREDLKLKDADRDKPWKVFAPACVNGMHKTYAFLDK